MKEKRDEMFVKREFTADWIDQHLLLLGVLASSSVFVLPVWEEWRRNLELPGLFRFFLNNNIGKTEEKITKSFTFLFIFL